MLDALVGGPPHAIPASTVLIHDSMCQQTMAHEWLVFLDWREKALSWRFVIDGLVATPNEEAGLFVRVIQLGQLFCNEKTHMTTNMEKNKNHQPSAIWCR